MACLVPPDMLKSDGAGLTLETDDLDLELAGLAVSLSIVVSCTVVFAVTDPAVTAPTSA